MARICSNSSSVRRDKVCELSIVSFEKVGHDDSPLANRSCARGLFAKGEYARATDEGATRRRAY